MRTLGLSLIIVIAMCSFVLAEDSSYDSKRHYKDAWGNSYKHYDNLNKDTDKDGVPNYYDYNDRDKNVQNPYQKDYSKGKSNNTFKPKKSRGGY